AHKHHARCHKSSHKYSIHWGTSSFVGRGFSLASTSRPLLKGVPAPNPKLPLASQTDIRSSLAPPFFLVSSGGASTIIRNQLIAVDLILSGRMHLNYFPHAILE